jgi:hypothetical protein
MPVLQIDQAALVCIAVIISLILVLACWTIHVLNASLNRALHEKAEDLESRQTTGKSPVVTSPVHEEKPWHDPEHTFRPEAGDIALPNGVVFATSAPEFEYVVLARRPELDAALTIDQSERWE